MAGSRSHFHIAISSGGLDTESGREFFQERLKIFAFWNGLLSFSFVPLRLGLEAAFAQDFSWSGVLRRPGVLPHLTASLTMMLVWLVTRRSRIFPIRTLTRIDALATCLVGTSFALMGAALAVDGGVLISDRMVAMLTATLAIAFTVIWRAVAIPSTPSRTAVVTAIAILPLVAADIWMLAVARPQGAANAPAAPFAVLWAVVTLALSIVASNVVFGLRREVERVRRLGQYTLDEKVGEGGMGVVYRARHAMLRRPTAIKLLPPQRMGQKNLQRFEHEVQLTAMLTHPNTVAIYDYGRTPDGVFYYAMEFLDGINLEDLVRRYGPQPAGRVVGILRQVCRALAEAHDLGVIHRDIKPANIILSERGGEPDVAKVVDFGLVKELDTANGSHDAVRGHESARGHAALSVARGHHHARPRGRAQRLVCAGRCWLLPRHRHAALRGTDDHGAVRASSAHAADSAFGAPGTCRRSAARSAATRMSREGSGAPASDRDGGSRDPCGK